MIFTDWYPPAYKAGGPVQSVSNLVELLNSDFNIKVVCRDSDLNSEIPLPGIQSGTRCSPDSKTSVLYLNRKQAGFSLIKSLIKENKDNIIYINGLYSLKFSLLPALFASYFGVKACFISVRGMLHASALSVKPKRKQIFLAFARGFGLYRHATLLASSPMEEKEIRNALGKVQIAIAPNIPLPPASVSMADTGFKKDNPNLRILFLGRIAPEKNPLTLIQALKTEQIACSVTFSGASLDTVYKAEFDAALKQLPSIVRAKYIGDVPHSSVSDLFKSHDILVLPSLGENFGHAIFESFAHGVPVVIGNNTPWTGIEEKKAGIEVEALNAVSLASAIQKFNAMDPEEYKLWSEGARKVALDYFESNTFRETYLKIFSH